MRAGLRRIAFIGMVSDRFVLAFRVPRYRRKKVVKSS